MFSIIRIQVKFKIVETITLNSVLVSRLPRKTGGHIWYYTKQEDSIYGTSMSYEQYSHETFTLRRLVTFTKSILGIIVSSVRLFKLWHSTLRNAVP